MPPESGTWLSQDREFLGAYCFTYVLEESLPQDTRTVARRRAVTGMYFGVMA